MLTKEINYIRNKLPELQNYLWDNFRKSITEDMNEHTCMLIILYERINIHFEEEDDIGGSVTLSKGSFTTTYYKHKQKDTYRTTFLTAAVLDILYQYADSK